MLGANSALLLINSWESLELITSPILLLSRTQASYSNPQANLVQKSQANTCTS